MRKEVEAHGIQTRDHDDGGRVDREDERSVHGRQRALAREDGHGQLHEDDAERFRRVLPGDALPKYTRPMKIARQNVLFMQAAPSRAAKEMVMEVWVFLPA